MSSMLSVPKSPVLDYSRKNLNKKENRDRAIERDDFYTGAGIARRAIHRTGFFNFLLHGKWYSK